MARRTPRLGKHQEDEDYLVALGQEVYGDAADQAVREVVDELRLDGERILEEQEFVEALQLAVAKGISIGAGGPRGAEDEPQPKRRM